MKYKVVLKQTKAAPDTVCECRTNNLLRLHRYQGNPLSES